MLSVVFRKHSIKFVYHLKLIANDKQSHKNGILKVLDQDKGAG